jgi:hypothetical protein
MAVTQQNFLRDFWQMGLVALTEPQSDLNFRASASFRASARRQFPARLKIVHHRQVPQSNPVILEK